MQNGSWSSHLFVKLGMRLFPDISTGFGSACNYLHGSKPQIASFHVFYTVGAGSIDRCPNLARVQGTNLATPTK